MLQPRVLFDPKREYGLEQAAAVDEQVMSGSCLEIIGEINPFVQIQDMNRTVDNRIRYSAGR